MIFDGVGIFLEDTMAVYVVLDPVICRKRNLTEVIIIQADKMMRELIVEKKAHFFEIYDHDFKKFWSLLEQRYDSTERQFKLAQATPRLKGLRIRHDENEGIQLTWNSTEAKKALPEWFWLEFRYFLQSTGLNLSVVPAQLHQVLFRFTLLPVSEVATYSVMNWHSNDCKKSYEILCREDAFYIKLSSQMHLEVKDIEREAKQFLQEFVRVSANSRIAYSPNIWKGLSDELSSGPSSIGSMPRDVYFLGIVTPLPSSDTNTEAQFLRTLPRSSLLYDFIEAPSTFVMKSISDLAKDSLERYSSENRFLSNALISYDMSQLLSLFNECDAELYNVESNEAERAELEELFMSVQIFPVFETLQSREYSPQIGITNVAWLKSVLREAAQLEDFQIDSDWLRAKINIAVQQSEIRRTIDSLIQGKMIVPKDTPGQYTVANEQVLTHDQVTGSEIAKYYHAVYESSFEIVKNIAQNKFFWSVQRFSYSSASFSRLREKLMKFSKGMLEKERQSKVRNGILQISAQLIPFNVKK